MIASPKPLSKAKTLAAIRKTPCLVCGKTPSDAAHIRTEKASGVTSPENLMPLCRRHHQDQHRIGIITFITKNPRVHSYVEDLGWRIVELNGKEYLWRKGE